MAQQVFRPLGYKQVTHIVVKVAFHREVVAAPNLLLEKRGRPVTQQLSTVHYGDPVPDRVGLVQMVGGQQDGATCR